MKWYIVPLFLVCLANTLLAQNKLAIDSLSRHVKLTKSDTAKVNLWNKLAWEYKNSDYLLTDSLAGLAIALGQRIDFHKGVGNGYINKAIALRTIGEYDRSIKTARWALVHFVKGGYIQGYSSAYNFIASVHFMQGNHNTALYYYYQSLKISESINDVQGAAKTLNNIGAINLEQRQYDKALAFFERAYNQLDILGDEDSKADCLNNIGNIYQTKNEFEKAIDSYQKSAAINERLGDKRDASASLHNIGLVYFDQGKYKEALSFYHQSLLIDEKMGDIQSIIITYGNIAHCYIKMGMYHAAAKYAKESFEMSKAFNMKKDIMNSADLLSQIEQQLNNYKEALNYHKLYKIYSDSLFNLENSEQLANLESQYLREKQEKQNILNITESEINLFKVQEKEREVTKYIFIIGLVLIIFVSLIYIVFFLVRRSKYS